MKDIVIVSNFAMLDSEGGNCRFHDIARRLGKSARVELVMSSFYHAGKCQREHGDVEHDCYKETLIHEPGYPKNVCLRRFYSHYKWGKGVIKYMRQRKKPDVIYCAMPSLTVADEMAKYCKEENIKFVIDIQDLWPEAFEMVLPVPFVFGPMRKQADRIYSQADLVVAVSETYAKRAMDVNKQADSMVVFLGSSFDESDKPVHKSHAGINVVYIGTVGASYDIRCMVDALKVCTDRGYTDVKGYVVGDGPELDSVKQYASEKGVPMEFTGRLPYTEMMKILEICDIAINPIRHRAAQSIINKVGDYAISGLPVVSSQENEEYRKLVDEWHVGYNCINGDAEDMAEKIMMLCDNPDERHIMGYNNRELAEAKFNRNKTYPEIVEKVLGLEPQKLQNPQKSTCISSAKDV